LSNLLISQLHQVRHLKRSHGTSQILEATNTSDLQEPGGLMWETRNGKP
jgi:hypothetical protein